MEIKVQCNCGARYSFEIEPLNGQMPYIINCPQCGADGTTAANKIIQTKLAATPAAPVPPATEKPRIRLQHTGEVTQKTTTPSEAVQPNPDVAEVCNRHIKVLAVEHCMVCGKPVCPECMQTFGYVCSINCRYRAEAEGKHIPLFAGQRVVTESNFWKKVARISGVVFFFIMAVIAVSIWYEFIGSHPKQFYVLKLEGTNMTSYARFLTKNTILLAGKKEVRLHDIKTGKDVWATKLPIKKETAPEPEFTNKITGKISFKDYYEDLYFEPSFYVAKDAIWVGLQDRILAMSLTNGTEKYSIPIKGNFKNFETGTDSLLVESSVQGMRQLTRINLASGEAKAEEVFVPETQFQTVVDNLPVDAPPTAAVLLNRELSENRITLRKLYTEFIPAGDNAVEMLVTLVKPNIIDKKVIKDAGPSMLNANTRAGSSANAMQAEVFNDIKRSRGGGFKKIDQSQYKVELRRHLSENSENWESEVAGPPAFFALKTVDLLVGGKSLFVFDKQNKKLFDAKLTYPINEAIVEQETAIQPCVEAENILYFFDQGVLTAFELPSGNVRWRVTTVGVSGVVPDGKGHLYVNTTAASPESIQYSEQIQIADQSGPVLLKIDAKTGKILWKITQSPEECSVSGKFIYGTRTQANGGVALAMALGDALGENSSGGTEHFRIIRLNPDNGKFVWEFYRVGAPQSVDFSENRMLLLFPQKISVMKFVSF